MEKDYSLQVVCTDNEHSSYNNLMFPGFVPFCKWDFFVFSKKDSFQVFPQTENLQYDMDILKLVFFY